MDRFQIFLTLIRDNVSITAIFLIHLTLRLTSSDGQQFDDEETSRSVRVVNRFMNCIYHRDRLGYEEIFGQNVLLIEIILVWSFDWMIVSNKAVFIRRFQEHGDWAIYIYIPLLLALCMLTSFSSLSTLAWLRWSHMCEITWGGYIALPPS